jgi:protein phosphatase PTC7
MVRNSTSETTTVVETVDNAHINKNERKYRSRAISRCTKNVDWILSSSDNRTQDTGYRPYVCNNKSKLNPNAKPFVPFTHQQQLSTNTCTIESSSTTTTCNVNILSSNSTSSLSDFDVVDMETSSPALEECNNLIQFSMSAGVASIPHPAKKHKGGEDAHFISNDNSVIGVADGVGGWEALGVDSGLYSRSLMNFACLSANSGVKNPAELLKIAHERCLNIQGSTTACIISLIDNKIHAANLGDSGFLIIRNGNLIFKTKEQQHYFNCPFQIGSSRDMPEDAQRIVVEDIQAGDIIVACTDGVFDNLFTEAILRIVNDSTGLEPSFIAQRIATAAHTIGCDPTAFTPFQDGAQKTGQLWQGGKLDDISCVVAKISLSNIPSENSIGA